MSVIPGYTPPDFTAPHLVAAPVVTVEKAPADGVVMNRLAAPGAKLMLAMDDMHSGPVDQRAEGCAERHLVEPGLGHVTGEAEQAGPR